MIGKYFKIANEMKDKIIEDRRNLHKIPEIGMNLPKTKNYIKNRLEEMGMKVEEVGKIGLVVNIKGEKGDGKTILLRADMDALPMKEESSCKYKSTSENAHTCGHDLHSAMLLNAAKIIYDNKDSFKGNVKIMFQGGEEIFEGARDMIENNVLDNPSVDYALAMHTNLDDIPGSYGYNIGNMTTSSDNFKITIKGKGTHGAYPHQGIDPIYAGVLLRQGFSEIIAREIDPKNITTLTLGQFQSGTNSNIIPDICILQGTLRSYDEDVRKYAKKRIKEMIEGVEKFYRVEIDIDFFTQVPSLNSDKDFTEKIVKILEKENPDLKSIPNTKIMASEDMALFSKKVPTTFLMLNTKVKGNNYAHHNPKTEFNEDALPIGTGIFATCSIEFLNNN